MKKLAFLIITAMCFSFNSFATHLMGGEIVATQIADSTYEVKLTTFRDTLGIPMDLVANFEVRDTSGSVIMNFSAPYDSATSGVLLPLYPYGVEVYCFIDTITLPNSGTFDISFIDCCRNGAIQNLANPLSESMFLSTQITYFDSTANSNPFFLVNPVIFLPVNTPWSYNPLPFDPDGDSLVWSIDTSLTAYQTNAAGYVTPSATLGGAFSMNSVTGTISWTASTMGNFVATVLVEEYRGGVKIGEIRRDMQFIVVLPTSRMPVFSNLRDIPTDNLGNFNVGILANTQYQFSFFAEDEDVDDVVKLEAFGEPMLLKTNNAKFTVVKTGKKYGNEVEGTFTWTPNQSMARRRPYIMVYRASDGTFARDEAVLYRVYANSLPTAVEDIAKANNGVGAIYPNPATSLVHIPMNFNNEIVLKMDIYTVNGIKVSDFKRRSVNAGNQIHVQQLDLSTGNYIVVFSNAKGYLSSQKLAIIR